MPAAILFFHVRVGGRLALQSFTPLFSAFLVLIVLQMYPAAFIAMIARSLYGKPPSTGALFMLAALSFTLPAWAAPRISHGLNGWIRHLPVDGRSSRRGVALALVVVQTPIVVILAVLWFAAHTQGIAAGCPFLLRLALLLIGAANAAVPAKHRFASGALSISAAVLVLLGALWTIVVSSALLLAADVVSGPLRTTRRSTSWRPADSLLIFRIGWRALGWRLMQPYAAAALVLGITALFITNNGLSGTLLSGSARFGGCMAVTVFLWILSERLAVRRPVWPWARSLPQSAAGRILADSAFLALHATPVALATALFHIGSAGAAMLLLPLLTLRAAGHMRRSPERRSGGGALVLDGFLASALVALLPWTILLALAATPAAFISSRAADSRRKVTRWLERHHEARGDSLSWSA